MGWKLKRINLCGSDQMKPNEEKDLCIELERENRAAIHGVVKFPSGKPVCGAVVKLFLTTNCDKPCEKDCELIPVTFAFTDECGQFLFGVDSCKNYVIKVFFFKPEKPVLPCEKKKDCEC